MGDEKKSVVRAIHNDDSELPKTMTLRVSSTTQIDKLGSAAIRFIKEGHDVELLAIGSAAVNQAVKGAIKARAYGAPNGKDILIKPAFVDVDVQGETKSAILLKLIVY